MAVCILFQAERGIFDILALTRLLRRLETEAILPQIRSPKKRLFIIIPVFNEQNIIIDTLTRLLEVDPSGFDVRITVATTIREESKAINPNKTTASVVQESLNNGLIKSYKNRIYITRDPDMAGNMATQLNYALSVLKSNYYAEDNDIFMVYNADSTTSPTTLNALRKMLSGHPSAHFSFQQPCAFIKLAGNASSSFINALSIYQSLYCLGHEYRLIEHYEKSANKSRLPKLGVIVGHGSGMTFKLHADHEGYPTDLLTEDLTFAYILSAKSTPISVLPAIEIADVPSSLFLFIKQRTVWFWNYIGYFSCFIRLRKKNISSLRLTALLIQGVGRGLYWLFLSFFFAAPIIIGITIKSPLIVSLSIASFLIFGFLPHYFLLLRLPDMLEHQGFHNIALSTRTIAFPRMLFPLTLLFVTDSIGPLLAIFQAIKFLFTRKLPAKHKSDHSHIIFSEQPASPPQSSRQSNQNY